MSYWFFPLFASPLYLIGLLAFGAREEAVVLEASPFDIAADTALVQLEQHEKIRERCPGCQSLIFAEPVAANGAAKARRVYLRCACSRCDRLFDLRVPEVSGN